MACRHGTIAVQVPSRPPRYLPIHFEESRDEELLRTIRAYPLGALVVNGPDGLDANHVPFLIDEATGIYPGQRKIRPRCRCLAYAHARRAGRLIQALEDDGFVA